MKTNEQYFIRAVRAARTKASKWAVKGDMKHAYQTYERGVSNAIKKWITAK